ncbi:MAG: FMN-binding negative transcriptional regulator [Propionibacteriaceae bacterium]|nr:transcriptional regulator [Propionibacteriaceae bacterium]HBY22721.1 transcriptional regulator [Propionibacteriaceae bacterium]
MYIPRHFAMAEPLWRDIVATAEVAELVTAHHSGPVVTMVPVVWRPDSGSLISHVARVNHQWEEARLGESLMVLNGPDHYIDPEWLPSFGKTRIGVPTWNYVTVHAYGQLIVHDDPDWLWEAVHELSARHGFEVGGAGEAYQRSMLRAIVGLELVISRVEAKAKLSQNKTPDDIVALVHALNAADAGALAALTEQIALPHAEAREHVVSAAAAKHRLGTARPV